MTTIFKQNLVIANFYQLIYISFIFNHLLVSEILRIQFGY